jgi:hypothetical protein
MKTVRVVAVLAVVIAAGLYFHAQRSAGVSPSPVPALQAAPADTSAQAARLAQEIDGLQRRLMALKAEMNAQQRNLSAQKPMPVSDGNPLNAETVQAQRAADAERHREYMAGVAQAFSNERVDPMFAARVSPRVGAAFDSDEGLQGVSRNVECRAQTCRVQIDDDGSGNVSRRMPFVALSLADVLPAISAAHVDQTDGRGTMVLYMSSQRASLPAAPSPR